MKWDSFLKPSACPLCPVNFKFYVKYGRERFFSFNMCLVFKYPLFLDGHMSTCILENHFYILLDKLDSYGVSFSSGYSLKNGSFNCILSVSYIFYFYLFLYLSYFHISAFSLVFKSYHPVFNLMPSFSETSH